MLGLITKKTDLKFMALRWPAFVLSGFLIIASFALIGVRGMNFGIDFVGGTVLEVEELDGVTEDSLRSLLSPLNLGANITQARGTGVDAKNVFVIKFGKVKTLPTVDLDGNAINPEQAANLAQIQSTQLVKDLLMETHPALILNDEQVIGPTVSGELLQGGLTALGAALILMLFYIWLRFEWQFSVGAVAALSHDVILTMGIFALLQIEFDLSTIAALLTIIGYSMNDTVVVFDRVREEKRKYKALPDFQVVDIALNGTLSRTLLTSITTLLALIAIFVIGGPVLRGMSFALIWGVAVGTYSSIFVASSILLTLGLKNKRKADDNEYGWQG